MRPIGRIDREFGVSLSLRDIFEYPTIAAMTERIGKHGGTRRQLPRARRSPHVPLSPTQESFWRIACALPGSPMFNQVLCVDVRGDIDADLLLQALGDVVRRHDALCATYSGAPGAAVQTIHRLADVPVTREQPADGRAAALPRTVAAELAVPFDLERQIPVRARLLDFAPESRVLVVTTHHIAFDGWSRGILVDDLARCYRVRAAGAEPAPAERGFSRYAAWQNTQRDTGAWQASVDVWREVLSPSLPSFRLPGACDAGDDFRTMRRDVVLDAELGRAVHEYAGQERTTPFTVLMTAFMAVTALACKADEGCAAIQVANRTWPEVDMIGPLANTLVLRAALDRSAGFTDFLREVRDAALLAFDLQDVPFEHVLVELRGAVDAQDLLRLGFALHEGSPEAEVPGGQLVVLRVDTGDDAAAADPTTFELVLELRPDGDGFRGEVTHKRALYPPEVIDDLVEQYRTFLTAALAAPTAAIGGDS
jgi:hypothetical protein